MPAGRQVVEPHSRCYFQRGDAGFGLGQRAMALLVVLLAIQGLAWPAAEEPKPAQGPVKIGLLPFEDATGGGSASAAEGGERKQCNRT